MKRCPLSTTCIVGAALMSAALISPTDASATDVKLQRLVLQASARGAEFGQCGASVSCGTNGINRILSIDNSMVNRATALLPTANARCRYWLHKVDDRPVLLATQRYFDGRSVAAAKNWGNVEHALLVRALRASQVC